MFFFLFLINIDCKRSLADPEPTPTIYPLSVSTRIMDISGPKTCIPDDPDCPITDFASPTTYKCGQVCWGNSVDSVFSYKFKGVQFLVYGHKGAEYGSFDLSFDGTKISTISEQQSESEDYALLYTSTVYPYGEHTIEVRGTSNQNFSIFKFAFWPHLKAKRLNITDMKSTGNWVTESDEIGGIRQYSNSAGSSKSLTIEASKLWVYGTPDPHHGRLRISFNTIDKIISTSSTRKDGTLLFESDEIPTTFHQLDLVSVDNTVLIYCVYYLYDPPEQTAMPYPSQSVIPDTNLDYINKKFIDQNIAQIFISDNQNADIKQISGCTFSNIKCDNTYFIKLDNDILFYDNRIEFSEASYRNPAALHLSSTVKSSMSISRCTFVNVVSSDNNDGNAINIRSSYDVLIDDCRFVNCYGEGRDGQAVVQQNSANNAQVKFIGCTFQFSTSTSACHAFIGDNSKLIIDHCTFSKCGAAILTKAVTTFEFTNNTVTSAGQEAIKIDNLRAKPIIAENTFKFNQIQGSNLITLIHNVDQIDITNNSFISNNLAGGDNAVEGGGCGLYVKSNSDSQNCLSITECFFTENQNNYASSDSNSNQGGALHLSSSLSTELIIKKCEFKGNKCNQGDGGAICAASNYNVIIEECTFESNIARNEGNVLLISQESTGEVKLSISKCHFINNGDNNKQKTMISGSCVEFVFDTCEVEYSSTAQSSQVFKLTANGDVTLSNTEFNNCSSTTASIVKFTEQKEDSTITVSKCNFFNCKSNSFTVDISKGTAIVSECTFTYITNDRNSACGSLKINCNGASCTFCTFTRAYASGALSITQVNNQNGEIVVSNCVFDDCQGENTRCFSIDKIVNSITFSSNTVKNMKQGGKGYFGLIQRESKATALEIKNITFNDNTCNALYGGGTGLWIKNYETIIFNDCKFINNIAVSTSEDRGGGYYPGDGGAIQYGHTKSISDVNMKFENCLFSKNKAVRHGGAIALQIQGAVDIISCNFEENVANYKLPSSSELLENYYSQKSEGRGGAIYINPSYTSQGVDYNTKSVNIESCTFTSNSAFDGFAIYIEGDAPVTTFTITGNKFISNHDNTDNSKNRGVIVTEVEKIMNDDIEGTNTFDLSPSSLELHAIIFVDHAARTPEPTPVELCNPRCYLIGDDLPNIFIPLRKEFIDIENEDDGGSAVHLENSGCSIVDSTFENCRSPNNGGGAIYINNVAQETNKTITIEKTKFKQCKSAYGGAVYIRSASENSPVFIIRCIFDSNQAITKTSRVNDDLFGGSAIYLNAKEGTILRCSFFRNIGPGPAMKVLNEFDIDYRSSLLQTNSVLVSDCLFETGNDQSSSIYYHGGKFGSNIELRNCIFSGILNKNAYHIDGKKTYSNSPRLNIVNCKFANDIKSSLNIKGDFLSINLKDQVFNMDSVPQKETSKSSFNLLYIVVGLAVTALLATIGVILVIKKSNQTSEEEKETVEESL